MPSTGQPVIIKNKIVYGYMDKATVCRDMGRADYNDLTEAQQLNGDVYFIQGVDASAFAPTNSLWNKVGTTPLDSELPADCSNAINQLKSNLTDLQNKNFELVAYKNGLTTSLQNFTYESTYNYTDYKEMIFVIAWNVGNQVYRASVPFLPSLQPLDAYYVIQLGSGFQAYFKFTGNKAGTMHYITPPTGLSGVNGYIYGIR